jgi:lipoate-protein ligase A
MIFSVSVMAQIIRYNTSMVESWFFLQSPAGEAATNMATDEVLLRTAAQRGRALLRVYSWLKPAISIGYFQKFPGGDREIVRRPTGGGLVYHGDDTTFTVVVPPGHRLHRLTTSETYRLIHEAVARATGAELQQTGSARGQYECFQKPVAGDVVANGRKLAGGAQRRNRDGMLHQGSIAARVTGEQLCRAFGVEFEPYLVTGEERAMVTWLADGKYRNDAWNKKVI